MMTIEILSSIQKKKMILLITNEQYDFVKPHPSE